MSYQRGDEFPVVAVRCDLERGVEAVVLDHQPVALILAADVGDRNVVVVVEGLGKPDRFLARPVMRVQGHREEQSALDAGPAGARYATLLAVKPSTRRLSGEIRYEVADRGRGPSAVPRS